MPALTSVKPSVISPAGYKGDKVTIPFPKESIPERILQHLRFAIERITKPETVQFGTVKVAVNYREWSPYMVRQLLLRTYEREERRVLNHVLSPQDRIIEIGGGIGLIALTARRVVPEDQIVVYEANPNLIPDITNNFKRNDAAISLVNAAIVNNAHTDTEITFFIHDNFWASGLNANASTMQSVTVPAKPIGDAISDHAANVLIMDIEGAECEVLNDINLDAIELICIELHPQYSGVTKSSELLRSLLNAGFAMDFENSWGDVVLFARPSRLKKEPALPNAPAKAA